MRRTPGVHHITAIASEPQGSLDFYTEALGLRLVKLTVNYDDPTTYHLYFGDASGRPGTILTFFPWPGAPRGRAGTGRATATAFAVPTSALAFWVDRFARLGLRFEMPVRRFDEEVLAVQDPDGMALELVGSPEAKMAEAWPASPVPAEHQIAGFHSVTLSVEGTERTARLLADTLGFRAAQQDGNRFRYTTAAEGSGAIVDLVCLPTGRLGRLGAGIVHHVAWRARDEAEQRAWRAELAGLGYNVTPVMDRTYFRSIYFREPGGVLFEIATDPPGFTADEPAEQLGSRLMLPPWLESHRDKIESVLPRLELAPSRARDLNQANLEDALC